MLLLSTKFDRVLLLSDLRRPTLRKFLEPWQSLWVGRGKSVRRICGRGTSSSLGERIRFLRASGETIGAFWFCGATTKQWCRCISGRFSLEKSKKSSPRGKLYVDEDGLTEDAPRRSRNRGLVRHQPQYWSLKDSTEREDNRKYYRRITGNHHDASLGKPIRI
jgi:hypothetical protein